jgi:hypothetical protein
MPQKSADLIYVVAEACVQCLPSVVSFYVR